MKFKKKKSFQIYNTFFLKGFITNLNTTMLQTEMNKRKASGFITFWNSAFCFMYY